MGRVGPHLHHRFRKVGSITPLYQDESLKFYWNHCWYCGVELFYNSGRTLPVPPNGFTRDHVYPASKGGGRGANTVPACNECNQKKKSLTLDEWRIKLCGKGGKFFAEKREEELRAKFDKKEIKASLRAQLSMIVEPKVYTFRPRTEKCIFYREQFVTSPLVTILRRLFHANLG